VDLMKRFGVVRWGSALALAGGLIVQVATSTPVAQGFDLSKLPAPLRAHVSGTTELALGAAQVQSPHPADYFPSSDECQSNIGSNIKVNQNCLNISDPDLQGRAQAQNETSVAVDPNNPQHIVASYNDYRRGDSTCGSSYSLDGGKTWNDSMVPNGFTRGNGTIGPGQPKFGTAPREYFQAGGDTSVAFDTKGNAYLSCQVFTRGREVVGNPDLSSAFLLFRSTHNGGASWNFPGRYTTFFQDVAGATEVAPGLGALLEDKALMSVDNHIGSPFQDRVYVTWTEFDNVAGTGYIYEVHSDDYGETFSKRVLVSTASTLCPFPLSAPGAGCDNNQFSQPFSGPDGTLYVVFANYNTVDFSVKKPAPANFQVLMAKSTDGGVTFGAVEKVTNYYELPDCATYQGGKDAGRACVPEKGPTTNSVFRAQNYPVGGVNLHNSQQVVVSVGSYISRDSQESNGCVPTGTDPSSAGGLYTGVKTAGACNNKIVISVSNNAGKTFAGTATDVRKLPTASNGKRQSVTDQWFHWLDFTRGGRMTVGYYDRQYGDDETTGFSDQSVAGADDLSSGEFGVTRVTSSSMPAPSQFSGTFWGDYGSLATVGDSAIDVWSDTRSVDLFICPGTAVPGIPPALCTGSATNAPRANDEDIFTARVRVPGGGGGD
jgi:hypothetical protein